MTEPRDLPPMCDRCGSTTPRDRMTVKLPDGTVSACLNDRWHGKVDAPLPPNERPR